MPDETRRQRVLVVDDDPVQLEYYMAVLESDYDVMTAHSINDAIEMLRRGTPVDALASDMYLGRGRSGIDLLAWVGEHQPDLITRFVIISGNPVVDTGAYSVRVIMKPVDPGELLQSVSMLLEQDPEQTITAG
ncbi:response regulator [Mariprofundus ferrooxydans]|uniref:response regulator n=1 Tax=Mariprofundus ferrooxydans TaxID=314344 RepID=UPI0014314537|nr:response regulator [Mariprofundus ferrooxydans]